MMSDDLKDEDAGQRWEKGKDAAGCITSSQRTEWTKQAARVTVTVKQGFMRQQAE